MQKLIEKFPSEARIVLRILIVKEQYSLLKENELQKGFCDICDFIGIFCHHNNMNTGNAFFGHKAKKAGTRKGIPDLLCKIDDELMLVELKTKKGRLSQSQKDLITVLNSGLKENVFVLYGVNDLMNFFYDKHLQKQSIIL